MFIDELWQFFRNPVYQKDGELTLALKMLLLLRLLLLSLLINICLSLIIATGLSLTGLEVGEHAVKTLFDNYSVNFILFAAVVLAPILEELLFRAPMFYFRHSTKFGFFFYLITFAFGFYHIINYELSATVVILSPLLVAPQIAVGSLLGFIRIRLGLLWAILLHASYNLVLVGSVIYLKSLEIPFQ